MNTLLFFDTETTGFPEDWNAPVSEPDKWPHLVQIAWVVASTHGYYLKSESHIIKPEGFTIPAESVQFHGITTETAQIAGIDLHLALRRYLDDLQQYDPLLVAHNLEFDSKVLDAAFHRVGHGSVVAQRRGVCTMKAATEVCSTGHGKWPKLEELYRSLFGEALSGTHNALHDAMATSRCFFELTNLGVLDGSASRSTTLAHSSALPQESSILSPWTGVAEYYVRLARNNELSYSNVVEFCEEHQIGIEGFFYCYLLYVDQKVFEGDRLAKHRPKVKGTSARPLAKVFQYAENVQPWNSSEITRMIEKGFLLERPPLHVPVWREEMDRRQRGERPRYDPSYLEVTPKFADAVMADARCFEEFWELFPDSIVRILKTEDEKEELRGFYQTRIVERDVHRRIVEALRWAIGRGKIDVDIREYIERDIWRLHERHRDEEATEAMRKCIQEGYVS